LYINFIFIVEHYRVILGRTVTIPSEALVLTLDELIAKTSYNNLPGVKLVVFAAVIVKLIIPLDASTIFVAKLVDVVVL
jgi:hypothetical protein